MEYAAIIAAAVSLISSLVGAGEDAKAQAVREKMLAQYGPEILPKLDAAIAERVPQAALGTMGEDDSLRRRQLDALSELENVYRSEGMTSADKAAMELANDQVSARMGAGASQYGQAMAQRGMVNSGLSAALGIAGQQAGANAIGGMARQNASDARSRALRALEGGATLAGGIRSDDFRRQQSLAEATDRINMFQTGLNTDANESNRNLAQQEFDNLMMVNQARSGAAEGVAGGYERGAAGTRQTGAGLANSALTYGMSYDGKKKKDD